MSADHSKLNALKIDRSMEDRSGGRRWLWLLLLLALALAGFWIVGRAPAPPAVVSVSARASSSSADQTVLNASGYVTARRRATVSAKTTGKVMEVLIEEGMRVEAGELLARLDDSNLRASLVLAQSQVIAAQTALQETKARWSQAQRVLKRTESLLLGKVSTPARRDSDQSLLDVLAARLERQLQEVRVAQSGVLVWQQQLDDMVIRAPFSGVVISKDAQPGEMISPVSAGGGYTRTGIGTLVDMESLEIEVDVNEAYINRVVAGQQVVARLDAYPDWECLCTVIAIVPTANRQKATVRVRIGFETLDPRIFPDMGVKVAFRDSVIQKDEVAGVAIPSQTLHNKDNQPIVFVLMGGHLERRAVRLGDVQGDDTVIIAGLQVGERVMLTGPANPVDGMLVKEVEP